MFCVYNQFVLFVDGFQFLTCLAMVSPIPLWITLTNIIGPYVLRAPRVAPLITDP